MTSATIQSAAVKSSGPRPKSPARSGVGRTSMRPTTIQNLAPRPERLSISPPPLLEVCPGSQPPTANRQPPTANRPATEVSGRRLRNKRAGPWDLVQLHICARVSAWSEPDPHHVVRKSRREACRFAGHGGSDIRAGCRFISGRRSFSPEDAATLTRYDGVRHQSGAGRLAAPCVGTAGVVESLGHGLAPHNCRWPVGHLAVSSPLGVLTALDERHKRASVWRPGASRGMGKS